MTLTEAAEYVRRIRNAEKRQYAADYLYHLRFNQLEPDWRLYDLTYMGAQAVRMQLDKVEVVQ